MVASINQTMEALGVEVNWDTIKAWCGKLG